MRFVSIRTPLPSVYLADEAGLLPLTGRPILDIPRPVGTISYGPALIVKRVLSTTEPMPRSNPKTQIVAIDLLSRFMSAMALGVLCAGLLLLLDPKIDLASVIIVHRQWLARLIFLLWVGFSFGLGVALAKVL